MARENIVSRFYGSEIEYTYTKSTEGDLKEQKPKIKKMGTFLINGSRMYWDIGNHPEYATPECKTLKELVTHEFAGEQIVWDAYKNGEERSDGIDTLHKRCIAPDQNDVSGSGKTSGAHENYSTSLNWKYNSMPKTTSDALAAHFATRTVFIGAGQATARDGYKLGQKMEEIRNDVGSTTTYQSKTLVNTRDESHSPGSSMHRLHVICGDANISPWAIKMKFGTTSLVLRLLEHGVDVSDLSLQRPLDAAYTVAGNVEGMKQAFTVSDGRSFTALNIQEELAKRAYRLSERIELPREEVDVINDWFKTVDALRNYSSGRELNHKEKHIMEQIDWYTKKEILDKLKERNKDKSMSSEKKHMIDLYYDLQYDKVPDGIGARLRKNRFGLYAPSAEDIEKAKSVPPEGRAKLRGAIIEKMSGVTEKAIDWSYFDGKSMRLNGDYSDEGIKQWLDENVRPIS